MFIKNSELITEDTDDGLIIYDFVSDNVYILNETAKYIWDNLDIEFNETLKIYASKIEDNNQEIIEKIENDFKKTINLFKDQNLIKEVI